MRRPAMYAAGLFLATGASLALAAGPAAAAVSNCKKHGSAASVHSTGHASGHGHRGAAAGDSWYPVPVPVGYPAGYYGGVNGFGNGFDNDCNTSIAQRNTQIGLINLNGIASGGNGGGLFGLGGC
ncbi:hypothetical protein Acy02nite_06350 [Actinoplanes cyaneus]|uniref:Secreted protein n=1 Tax=Actinoplanes cyaneus TaxID=52696 RepID=A0A919IBK5_9ACTN|nr:hypothetical protein [Actinoplanes cyaneus]MCW2135880.1 hypothetical protein [Actinoplanes cyaneus]GID62754.1 hypothetical protein Acy02nite_06350 [Actinoplanes cyaneus]